MKENKKENSNPSKAAANHGVGKKSGGKALPSQSTIQKKANETGLPDNLKSGVENLSGMSMDDVKVHYNSSKPSQLNAHAYAQGSDVHLGAGQEKHLPHEAWHVAQQMQGRVKPTMQLKGKGVNNDDALEKEADIMGDKAASQTDANNSDAAIQAKFNSTNSALPLQRVARRSLDTEEPGEEMTEKKEQESLPESEKASPNLASPTKKSQAMSAADIHAQMAFNPHAGEIVNKAASDKVQGEPQLSTWEKIKKKAVMGVESVKGGIASTREQGGGSFFRGLLNKGKNAWGEAKKYGSEKLGDAKRSAHGAVDSIKEAFASDPNDTRSFAQKQRDKGDGSLLKGLGRSALGGLKTAGSFLGKGAAKLATGKSTDEIKDEWKNSEGTKGKAITAAKNVGRVINRLSFGSIGGILKGGYKIGTGIGGMITGGMNKSKANKSENEHVKTYVSPLAGSQMMEGGNRTLKGATDVTSNALKLAGQKGASSIVGGVGGALGKIGDLAIGEGAGKGVGYLNRGQLSQKDEMGMATGFTDQVDAMKQKDMAERHWDGKTASRHNSEASRLQEKAAKHKGDVEEGRTVLKPSDVARHAKAEFARLKLKEQLSQDGSLTSLKQTQDMITD